MKIEIGFVPYLNMVPFHAGFGPESISAGAHQISFRSLSPRALGIEAEKGTVVAGALSLMDTFRLAETFEPLGNYGIGVKNEAQSVLLFSRKPLEEMRGICSVTDETATSVILLKILLENHYNNDSVLFGRIASAHLFDGEGDGVLLIGDEALRARQSGVTGFPIVTDLAEEWYRWQGKPFAFARWCVRKETPTDVKDMLSGYLQSALNRTENGRHVLVNIQAGERKLSADIIENYWAGFDYRLQEPHFESIRRFEEFTAKCLTR